MSNKTERKAYLGTSYPASPESVTQLLSMPIFDGRSEWKWFTLANGDLVLGFYPQADGQDGYYTTEAQRDLDYFDAEKRGTLRIMEAEREDTL